MGSGSFIGSTHPAPCYKYYVIGFEKLHLLYFATTGVLLNIGTTVMGIIFVMMNWNVFALVNVTIFWNIFFVFLITWLVLGRNIFRILGTNEIRSFIDYLYKRKIFRHNWVTNTDIEKRYQTPNTAPCNGVVSYGAQIGGLRDFADHTRKSKRKTNALTIFARRAAFSVWLFSRSARSTMQ